LVVRNNAYDKNGLAGFDFVAGGEHGLLNLCAIQMGAIRASFVDDAAAVRAALDGEVNTGHVIVVRDGELGAVGSAPNQKRLACQKRDLSPCEWSRVYL